MKIIKENVLKFEAGATNRKENPIFKMCGNLIY